MTYDPKRHHRRSIRLKGYDYSQPGAYYITIVCQDRACLFGEIVDGEMQLNDAGRMVQAVWDEIPQYYPGVDVDAGIIMPTHMHGVIILFDPNTETADPPTETPNDDIGTGQPQGVAPTTLDDDIGTGQPQGATPTTLDDDIGTGQPQGAAPTTLDDDIGTGQPQGATPTTLDDDIGTGQPQGATPTTLDDDIGTGQPQGAAPTERLSLPDVVHRFKTLTTKRYTDGVKELGWPRYRKRVWQRNYYEHIIRSERILQRVREYIDANPANWDSDNENPDVFNRKEK